MRHIRFRRRAVHRFSTRRAEPSIHILRYRLAIAVIVLFLCACLGVLLVPTPERFDRILLVVGSLLGLVVRYYFGQPDEK